MDPATSRIPPLPVQQIERELAVLADVASCDLTLESRTPSYCAGCPHRGTSSAILEIRRRFSDPAYMQRAHGRAPVAIVAHGGIGCYSLNFLPPFRDMHDLAAMGLAGAAGMGCYPFSTNKHYVLCGDSTFFHSEMVTLSNAIKDNQDILYIILDNKNTAMTGHQTTPASDHDIMGNRTIQQDIESVVRGLDTSGRVLIRRIDPSRRDGYMALLEDAFLMDGVRVLIADRECGITYHRRKRGALREIVRRRGFLPVEQHINITPEVCENCRECTLATGCPGLTIIDTPYREKIGIDASICVDDRYCTKIKACPSFEQVVVTRRKAPRRRTGNWDLWMKDIPEPAVPALPAGGTRPFCMFIPGVGGMGLGFIARLLTEAGAREGYQVNYYHQKGLAQRNGAVVSHVLFAPEQLRVSQRIPDGKADLVLGLDFLETVRGLSFAHAGRTAVVCNTARTPTIGMLLGEDRFPDGLEARIAARARDDAFFAADFFELSEHYFGNRVYANLMMLGSAYQMGVLPLRAESVEDVIRHKLTRSERENNLRAFRLGRRLISHPDMRATGHEATGSRDVLSSKAELPARHVARYSARMSVWLRRMPRLGGRDAAAFSRRYADLVLYDGFPCAETYAGHVARVYDHEHRNGASDGAPDNASDVASDGAPDSASDGASDGAATSAVIRNLYKVTAIKDEIWVAQLLTSPEKLRHDRIRYNVDPRRGDRIRYRHFNRPQFDLLGRTVAWDMVTRNWMLRGMKRLRVLRRLLPVWHARERAFRDWYRDEVIAACLDGRLASRAHVLEALELPSTCTGYRDVVYPKHDAARERFRALTATSTETA